MVSTNSRVRRYKTRALRNVVDKYPEVAWKLLLALLPNRHDMVSPNAKPRWRDDDAGTNESITYGEIQRFILPVADLLLEKAQDNAQHIADLVPKINDMDTNFRER